MSEVKSTHEIVQEWIRARDIVDRTNLDADRARAELHARAQDLAERMIPSDLKNGETICVWVRLGFRYERLVAIRKVEGNYQVGFRGEERLDPEAVKRESCKYCGAEPGHPCDTEVSH